jgi:hypothetical protein
MMLAGIDINATCARGVTGPDGICARALNLDDHESELPMAISMEGRRPEAGSAGVALVRKYPHLACLDMLSYLGTDHTWRARRIRLDPNKALSLLLDKLRQPCAEVQTLAFTLPGYVSRPQAEQVMALARKARLPAAGSLSAFLALAMAAPANEPLPETVGVLDLDDHALSWALLKCTPDNLLVGASQNRASLGMRVWKGHLIDAIAESCIRHSRRDLRDSGSAEQMLYDQLDDVLDISGQGRLVEVVIRTAHWCQNLILQPQQVVDFCRGLVEKTLEEMMAVLDNKAVGFPRVLLVSAEAARLPGLVAALEGEMAGQARIVRLPLDAAARSAHQLAARFQRGSVATGHLADSLPLPRPKSSMASSPRVIPIAARDR